MQVAGDELKKLFERLQENEDKARKFFEVEASVLSILNFKDFFSKLPAIIKEKFAIPHVWMSLITSGRAFRSVESFAPECLEDLITVDRKFFHRLIPDNKPLLMNQNLNILKPILPDKLPAIGSSAAVPLTFYGQSAGSLNFADSSLRRFQPGIDTVFLEQLGVIVSICLSNVAAHEELNSLAFRDALTGILNRRAMERALKREFIRARRYLTPMSLVFIDLDDFKKINDKFGHDCGDEVLKLASSAMSELARQTDIVARYAGDEFVCILPGTAAAEAEGFVQRLLAHFKENTVEMNGEQIEVKFSHGIACAADGGVSDTESLIKKADEILYDTKLKKKGRSLGPR